MKQLPQLRVTTLILLAAAWLCTPPAYAQTAVEYYDTAEEFVGPFPSWKNVKTDYGAVGDGRAGGRHQSRRRPTGSSPCRLRPR